MEARAAQCTIKAYSLLLAPVRKNACSNAMSDGNYNLSSDSSCVTGVLVADPQLGPLQDNGGYRWTHALGYASPAIDAADTASCVTEDQRLAPRPLDGDRDGQAVCDIGGF